MNYYEFKNFNLLLLYRYMELYDISKFTRETGYIVQEVLKDNTLYNLIMDMYPYGFTKQNIKQFDLVNTVPQSDTYFDNINTNIKMTLQNNKIIFYMDIIKYKTIYLKYLNTMYGLFTLGIFNDKINNHLDETNIILGSISLKKINRTYTLIENIDISIIDTLMSDDITFVTNILQNIFFNNFITYATDYLKNTKFLIDKKYVSTLNTPEGLKFRTVSLQHTEINDDSIMLIESALPLLYEQQFGIVSTSEFEDDVTFMLTDNNVIKFINKYKNTLYKYIDITIFEDAFNYICKSIYNNIHINDKIANIDILFNTISNIKIYHLIALENMIQSYEAIESISILKNINSNIFKEAILYKKISKLQIHEIFDIWEFISLNINYNKILSSNIIDREDIYFSKILVYLMHHIFIDVYYKFIIFIANHKTIYPKTYHVLTDSNNISIMNNLNNTKKDILDNLRTIIH